MSAIARVNNLELRLSCRAAEVRAAQRLRYDVFYEELGARADEETARCHLDRDRFDAIADHLIVVDLDQAGDAVPAVVGCYRLLRHQTACRHGGLYTAQEFDLSVLAPRADELVELGRSCVHPDHRNGTVMQLLWRGVAHYIEQHGIGVMLGCASLPGTDLEMLAPALAYLRTNFLAPPELRPRALDSHYIGLGGGVPDAATLRRGKAMLPPLLKAYLRMGGMIGDGAVVDHQFNTVDVCLVLPTDRVRHHYARHYMSQQAADRAAA